MILKAQMQTVGTTGQVSRRWYASDWYGVDGDFSQTVTMAFRFSYNKRTIVQFFAVVKVKYNSGIVVSV